MASALKQLKLSSVTKPTGVRTHIDPMQRVRIKFIAGVDEQIAFAKDSEYKMGRIRYKDGVKEEYQKAPNPWWFFRDDVVYLTPRYGVRALDIGGKASIEVGAKDNLPATLGLLKEACESGELDDLLSEAKQRKIK